MSDKKFIRTNDGEEVIIRNKKRMTNNTVVPRQEAYVPEYKRLELEPKVYSHNRDDFRMYTPKKRQMQQEPVKSQPFVHSGQNTDWVKNNSNENIVEDESFQDDILYDDVQLPDEDGGFAYEVDNRGNNETNGEFSLLDIQPGQYVLLCENDVIQYGTLQEIEAAIEHLLLSNDNSEELYSKLFVFKRMGIKTGVFID